MGENIDEKRKEYAISFLKKSKGFILMSTDGNGTDFIIEGISQFTAIGILESYKQNILNELFVSYAKRQDKAIA